MYRFNTIWSTTKGWTKQLKTKRIAQQQWSDADSTELQRLPSGLNKDTTYNPHSPDSRDMTFIDLDEARPRQYVKRQWLKGWRFGAINCAMWASIVFLINLVVTIWGSVHNKSAGEVLMDGDCDKVRQMNTVLHLIINALSTILLSGSNYCMQCLSAPTRNEIDQAHAKGNWLDVGVPSIRNLRSISWQRSILWALLGLSSLPLHLFYNSAVFASISSNDYATFSVPQSFVDSEECLNCNNITARPDTYYYQEDDSSTWGKHAIALHDKARKGELDRLSNADCINEYAQMINTNRRDVLLVASDDKFPKVNNNTSMGNSKVFYVGAFVADTAMSSGDGAVNAYQWMCSAIPGWTDSDKDNPCTNAINSVKNDPSSWSVRQHIYTFTNRSNSTGFSSYQTSQTLPIEYCLSEKAEPRCKLKFSLTIAILVTVLNFFKAAVMFYTAFKITEDPVMNMGDAVASFLEKPDPTTKGMCLLTIHDVKKHKGYFPAGPKSWTGERHRWKDIVSKRRRWTTITMFSAALIVVISLLAAGLSSMPSGQSKSLKSLASLGYGAVDPRTIIYWYLRGTIANVVMANFPQPILSFLYFSYNGVFTAMLLGYEWNTYAHRRKGLRVSRAATGNQRSTYFLQLPYRFALPLMGLSGLLHWLVSQSIFLVAVDYYGLDTLPYHSLDYSSAEFMTCGYSPIAIITVIIMGILMVAGCIGFGFIPYKPGATLAGSCSAAISAACHSDGWDEVDGYEAATEKLKWGVVGKSPDGVGHCTFSTKQVELPIKGEVYAGPKLLN